jgi:hypothetical protein
MHSGLVAWFIGPGVLGSAVLPSFILSTRIRTGVWLSASLLSRFAALIEVRINPIVHVLHCLFRLVDKHVRVG